MLWFRGCSSITQFTCSPTHSLTKNIRFLKTWNEPTSINQWTTLQQSVFSNFKKLQHNRKSVGALHPLCFLQGSYFEWNYFNLSSYSSLIANYVCQKRRTMLKCTPPGLGIDQLISINFGCPHWMIGHLLEDQRLIALMFPTQNLVSEHNTHANEDMVIT